MSVRATVPESDELDVEKLVPGGHALVRRPNGEVVLLRGALPGDRVRLFSDPSGQAGRVREHFELVRPSPDRREPPCAVAERCGGCDWMALEERAQAAAKLELFRDALERVGGLDGDIGVRWVQGAVRLGYRNRVRLQLQPGGKLGFYARGSHELVEPPGCLVLEPELTALIERVRELALQQPAWFAPFAHLELGCSSAGDTFLFLAPLPVARGQRSAGHGARARAANLRAAELECRRSIEQELGVTTRVQGEPFAAFARYDVPPGAYLYAPPGGFTQVNWEVNLRLIERLLEHARETGCRSFADLYCGSGNFAVPLAKLGLSGIGVESHEGSVLGARRAVEEQRLGLELVVGEARREARRLAREGRAFDLVVIDPPRAGVKQGLEEMLALGRGAAALVGCDPVTFARDLRRALGAGWQLGEVAAFDMFPQTHHVEGFAWLTR